MCRNTEFYGVLVELRAERNKAKLPLVAAARAKKKEAAPTEFVDESVDEKKKPVAVKDGQQHIKGRLLKELDDITTALVEKAKGGGTAHLRLLWDLGKLDQDPTATVKRRPASLSALLLREIREKESAKKLGK